MNKKLLTEQEIRTRYITPAIQAAGWRPQQMREEVHSEAWVAEVLQLPPINQIGLPVQILSSFGSKVRFLQAVRELEQEIYRAA